MSRRPHRGWWQIFRWPLAMGLANAVGLIAALVGDRLWDLVSWITLGATVAVMVAAWRGQVGALDGPRKEAS